MSHSLLLMLENIDRRKNEIVPFDSNLDTEILQDHHKQLMVRHVNPGSHWHSEQRHISFTEKEHRW